MRQEGVGLSMLRNVTSSFIKNKYLRSNKGLEKVFVTLININSVSVKIYQSVKQSPVIDEGLIRTSLGCGKLEVSCGNPVELMRKIRVNDKNYKKIIFI